MIGFWHICDGVLLAIEGKYWYNTYTHGLARTVLKRPNSLGVLDKSHERYINN